MKRHRTRTLFFDETHRRYGAFCLGSAHVIRIDDVSWPTDRHYLLAMQYPCGDLERVRQTASYNEAQRSLRAENARERIKWDVVRDDYLLKALQAKFTQHLDLEALLARTGDSLLVYKNREDRYYGLGPDGTGHNMFGRLLMRVRHKIRTPPCDETVETAVEHYEQVVREKPDDIMRLIKLAEVYLVNNMAERASATAYQAVRIEPTNLSVRLLLGQALVARAQYREAVEHLRLVNRNAEPIREVLELLATAYRGLGRVIAARVLDSRARRLGAAEAEGESDD